MKIAYGIASEGMGHYTRSRVAIDYLTKKGHEIHIFSSDKVYELFSQKYDRVHRIEGFHLVYKDGVLEGTKSTVNIIRELPKKGIKTLKMLLELFDRIKPDVIVSDFEPFVAAAAKRLGIPLIAANNISIIYKTECIPRNLKISYNTIITGTAEYLTSLRPDYFIIPTFFFPKAKAKNIILTYPPIREVILNHKVSVGEHILVYHTSDTAIDVLHMIRKIDVPFKVYGFGKKESEKKISYHEFSEDGFAHDLATAKAVITGGGFSLISEALHLKKPVFSIPVKKHPEQIINGINLQKLKYGDYSLNPKAEDIQDFILKQELYNYYLKNYNPEPEKFQETIEEVARHLIEKRKKH